MYVGFVSFDICDKYATSGKSWPCTGISTEILSFNTARKWNGDLAGVKRTE